MLISDNLSNQSGSQPGFHQRILDNLSVAVYAYDAASGELKYGNHALLDLLGYESLEEVQRDRFCHLLEDDEFHHEGIAKLTERAVTSTYPIRQMNGRIIWVSDSRQGIFSASGELLSIEGSLTQTPPPSRSKKQKLLNATIQRAKQEWEASVDALADVVCLLDREGTIIRSNRAIEHWGLGNVKTINGTNLVQLMNEKSDFVQFENRFNLAWEQIKKHHNRFFELPNLTNQQHIYVQLNRLLIEDDTHPLARDGYAVVIISDISLRKQLEDDLKQLNAELDARVQERTLQLEKAQADLREELKERAKLAEELSEALAYEKQLNAFRSRFATMIVHEFRTPMTIIQTSVDLLERFSDRLTEEKRKELPARIRRQIEHLVNMLDDIMTLSKADTIGLDLMTDLFSLGDLIESVCQEGVDIYWKTHQLKLGIYSNDTLIQGDRKQIRRLIINLIGNAVKYADPGTTVYVDVEREDKYLTLRVRDEGIGIPDEAQPHLFDIFYRASNIGQISGTGLGLAIVKLIADLHNAPVQFSSEVGQGTTFTIKFPLQNSAVC